MKTSNELATIARAGGSIKVAVRGYTANELATVARALVEGAQLILTGSDALTTNDMSTIARAKKGQVLFEM